jgi:predicted HTH transcriptional regulator
MMQTRMMKPSEAVKHNAQTVAELKKLVSRGEGLHLEFKRKAAHPEKIIREMIAFANTEGGTLLVGVGDDGSLAGIRFPEDDSYVIRKAADDFCKPALSFEETIIPLARDFILRYDIPKGDKRPYYFIEDGQKKETFTRNKDMSVKASREMKEIIRRSASNKGVRFMFGDHEKKLMEYLEVSKKISLNEFKNLTGLNRIKAAKKLILLVLANVLSITPTEKGDIYSRR